MAAGEDKKSRGALRLSRRGFGLFGLGLAAAAAAGAIARFGGGRPPDEQLRRRIGQMLMVGFRGASIGEPGPATLREQIARGEIGGVLYLARNIAGLEEVRAMNRAFLEAGGALPPLIAVDQEGGRIERLTSTVGFTETPSAQWFGRYSEPISARSRYAALARDLAALGFNANLGPVVDLDLEPRNPVISRLERSYGRDPEQVAAFAAAFVEAHRDSGMVTALKHFPGHGSSLLDSHRRLPDITASWRPEELAPYRALFAQKLADTVMAGHLALRRPGGDALPATLSPALITGLLRKELGFDGVVMSDDMDMGAIADDWSLREAVLQAIHAGTDILIVSNVRRDDPLLPEKLVEFIGREAMQDAALRAMIDKSYTRIVALKKERLAGRAGSSGVPQQLRNAPEPLS